MNRHAANKHNPKTGPAHDPKPKPGSARLSPNAAAAAAVQTGSGESVGRVVYQCKNQKQNKTKDLYTPITLPRESVLMRAHLTMPTRDQYLQALKLFKGWLQSKYGGDRIAADQAISTYEGLDDVVSLYYDELFESNKGKGYQSAVAVYSGLLMLVPSIKNRLPGVKRRLKAWRVAKPSVQHPPLTWPLTCAIAHELVRMGYQRAAVAVLLSFDCLFRVSEVCGIRVRDVVDSSIVDQRMGRVVSITLPNTKSGTTQSVTVDDKRVVQLLECLVAPTAAARPVAAGDKVFGLTSGRFRVLFKQAAARLGLSPKFVPHSLRHGGATTMYMLGRRVEDIKVRGRWKRLETCERYIQSGRAVIGTVAVPPATLALGHAVAAALTRSLVEAERVYIQSRHQKKSKQEMSKHK